MAMTSLWLADRIDRPSPPNPLLEADHSADVVVIGAGLTGLTTAVLLARAGKDVLVLEAHSAGAGATGNTTAKISLLQGTKMSKIVGKHGPKIAQQYVQGNREGLEWLIAHCEAHGISVQREDAYTYAQSDKGVAAARAELEACTTAGLEAEWADDADVPFPYRGGVRLAHQAQFDPMPLLDSLIVDLDERGGRLAQGVRVQRVSTDGNELVLQLIGLFWDVYHEVESALEPREDREHPAVVVRGHRQVERGDLLSHFILPVMVGRRAPEKIFSREGQTTVAKYGSSG